MYLLQLIKKKNEIKYVLSAKRGSLSKLDITKSNLYIVKIYASSHFTIAIVDTDKQIVEYWDPNGTSGNIQYDEKERAVDITKKRRQQTRSTKETQCLVYRNGKQIDYDTNSICQYFKHILPTFKFISINIHNLQIMDEDAYCQTWVFLYVYMRFVFPKLSQKLCHKFFKSKTKKELLQLVKHWSYYLLSFDPKQLKQCLH